MQRRQGVCASTSRKWGWRSGWAASLQVVALLTLCALVCTGISHAQGVNTATLAGTVVDPSGAAVKGAKVTVTNAATGAKRTAESDDSGRYNLVGLPPGQYKMSVDGGANFAVYENPSLTLTVGENASFDLQLVLKGQQQSIVVTSETSPIETTKTEVSDTITQRRIDNLPINGRNYINFTLTNSKTTRDVSPTIGPAPNSGLNVGGARARSNLVSVDGADAGDNSINGIRSTISQEGVQEFQLILSNYNAEYGRATGGVINIVTKGGGNDFHGNAFGFFRNKSFQARNPFSGVVDANGVLQPTKQGYTRTQSGLTFGGPLKRDQTFYFFSYEYTQREETGFSSIGTVNFGLTKGLVPCIPVPLSLTRGQLAFYQGALTQASGGGLSCSNPVAAQLEQAVALTAAGSNVAVNSNINVNFDGTPVPLTSVLGYPSIPGLLDSKIFPVPVACRLGMQVNKVVCLPKSGNPPGVGIGFVELPSSYVGLISLRGNYPVMEKTSLWSARFDHHWNNRNNSFLRVRVSPSLAPGLPSTSHNQVFGQNSGPRAGYNQSRDLNVTFQHDTVTSPTSVNTFRFQYARRGLHFGFSQLPGGDQIGVNIPGVAYFGREPYSTVDRIERRTEFTDTVAKIWGKHTFKFGADVNLVQLRSAKAQIFELDFGGVVNFGGISAETLNKKEFAGLNLPGATNLQAYGLGIPTTYIQGIGNSNQPLDNLPFGFFAQDSWRINRKLTLNYGVRYDVEITPLFAPATAVNAAAEKALGVVEGIPRDYNNVAPRFGLAWDPAGNGKTVIRAGYGLFYDHPLLAVAFDAATADGGRSVQLLSAGGTASACGLVTPDCAGSGGPGSDTPGNLNGSSIFQGALNTASADVAFAPLSLAYLPNQQRFNPLAANSLFANQNYLTAGFPLPILPFTLPVAANFKYGYAQQGNLTIERQLAGSWTISVGYQYTRGIHLNRPVDVNSTDPQLLDQNALNAVASGLSVSNPVTVVVPSGAPGSCVNTGTGSIALIAPGALGQAFAAPGCNPLAAVGLVGTPAFFNFFRRSGAIQ